MTVDQHLDQIRTFVSRKDVDQYLIGITANMTAREASYKRIGFDYFELLSEGHDRDEALAIEKLLFESCIADKALKGKYHRKKVDKPYRASTGGKIASEYSVYIAGFAP